MNYVIVDTETEVPLYGMALMDEIIRKQKRMPVHVYRIPGEAWVAFLQVRYSHVPEVRTYLKAVENDEGINPREGALLVAVDDRCDIPEEEFLHGMSLCKIDPQGEAW